MAIPARTGYSNPWLGYKVFVLLSRSMLRSLRFRSLNAVRSRCSSSLEGSSPTLLLVVPSSATQRLFSVAAHRPLPAWHRQRPDPPQHLSEQLAVEIPLGQQQPVIPRVLDQPAAGPTYHTVTKSRSKNHKKRSGDSWPWGPLTPPPWRHPKPWSPSGFVDHPAALLVTPASSKPVAEHAAAASFRPKGLGTWSREGGCGSQWS